MAQKKRKLDTAIAAIEEAEHALTAAESADRRKTLHDVIEVFKVKDNWSWTNNYCVDP